MNSPQSPQSSSGMSVNSSSGQSTDLANTNNSETNFSPQSPNYDDSETDED